MTERFDAKTIANHLKKKKKEGKNGIIKMERAGWREEAAQLQEEEEMMFS